MTATRVLVGLGIVLMVYAVVLCRRLIQAVTDRKLRPPWYVLLFLICFFLAGYTSFLFFMFTSAMDLGMTGPLIGSILFLGAVFVVLVLAVGYVLVTSVNRHVLELDDKNRVLTNMTVELREGKEELEKAKKEQEEKNKEMEAVLEDFYTLRIGVGRDVEAGKFEEENKRIKERLDKLKQAV